MAAFLSFKKGYLKEGNLTKIELLGSYLLKKKFKTNNINQYINFILNDKKNMNGKIGIVIIEDIGNVKLKYFTDNEIKEFLGSYNEYISN